ncbi:MAG: 3-phosphoshikimate 1-carboxyvinyltransferase [Bacteroidota bacterium]|nr:3-phosphoshikimate 1-carboxyvinyltransferase [Bacteroidota bacterium]
MISKINTVSYSEVHGKLSAPASKSVMIRAIVAATLARGTSILLNPSFCEDSISAMKLAEFLGAKMEQNSDHIIIEGGNTLQNGSLNCGESGLSLRMFSAVASLFNEEMELIGTGSLKDRPLGDLAEPLRAMGVEVTTNNGFLPVKVKGPLRGGRVKINGSLSSQFLTGMLMSLPLIEADSFLVVENLKSKAYIDLSLNVMRDFGIVAEHNNYLEFHIPGGQTYKSREYFVEGDWSGAAFLLTAGAIAGQIEVSGLDPESMQADKMILEALKKAGARIEQGSKRLKVSRKELNAFQFDVSECPDLAPPLVSLASHCKGTSVLSGIERLIAKESNRAKTLKEEFEKLGIKITIEGKQMKILGGRLSGGRVISHNDHRIAMAVAVAALRATDTVSIDGSECVSKSYPGFFNDLKLVGGNVYETNM